MDQRTRLGPILTNGVGVIMLVTFAFNVVCYGSVWFKLKQVNANASYRDGLSSKYA